MAKYHGNTAIIQYYCEEKRNIIINYAMTSMALMA